MFIALCACVYVYLFVYSFFQEKRGDWKSSDGRVRDGTAAAAAAGSDILIGSSRRRRRRRCRRGCWPQHRSSSETRHQHNNAVSRSLTLRELKMERQKMRQHQRQQSVDTASMADPIITPPGDFQDQTANEDQDCYPSGDGNKPDLLDPPAMFKSRPRTELFWSSGGGGGGGDDRCVFPPWPVVAIDESASQAFHQELERLKSHSLLLRFPADGTARVHYRSSKSVVEYSSTLHQYR